MRRAFALAMMCVWFLIPFGLSWMLPAFPVALLFGADVVIVALGMALTCMAGLAFLLIEDRFDILDRLRSEVGQ